MGKVRNKQPNKKHAARMVHEDSKLSDDTDDEVLLVVNDLNSDSSDKILAMFSVKGQKVPMQVDSGATCNVMPKNKLPPNAKIQECRKKLSLYGNKASIMTIGKCTLPVKNVKTHKKYDVQFVIVDEDCIPLIGLRMGEIMKIVRFLQKSEI